MRYRKKSPGGSHAPPFIDPAFADALNPGSSRTGRQKPDHKTQQLCRQVQRALNLSLGGEFGDDLFHDLYVSDVAPAPSASHLLVHVNIPSQRSVAEVMSALERAAPRLRAEVARSITRKRAPDLTFIPAAPQEVRDE